jgi:hypothetical protein
VVSAGRGRHGHHDGHFCGGGLVSAGIYIGSGR